MFQDRRKCQISLDGDLSLYYNGVAAQEQEASNKAKGRKKAVVTRRRVATAKKTGEDTTKIKKLLGELYTDHAYLQVAKLTHQSNSLIKDSSE